MYLAPRNEWYTERLLWIIGGTITLISCILGILYSEYWFILTIFVGVNQIIFGLTGFCLMANILFKLGIKPKIR